jgi:MFS family permease
MNAQLLLLGRLFMSASQSLSSVAVPLALISTGMTSVGIGGILAAMIVLGMVEMVIIGAYADRGHLRLLVTLLPSTSVICAIPFLLGANAWWLGVATVIGGYGGGSGATSGGTGPYQPAEYGWVAHSFSHAMRTRLISVFSATSVAGVLIGGILTLAARPLSDLIGFGPSTSAQAKTLMLFVAILAVVPTVVGLLVTEPVHIRPAAPAPGEPRAGSFSRLWRLIWPSRSQTFFWRQSIVGGLNGAAIGCYGSFVTVWLIVEFQATTAAIGILNIAIAAGAVVGDSLCPALARRYGLVRAITVTRYVQALLIIPITFAPTLFWAEALLFVRQMVQRLNLPLRDSYAISQASDGEKGRVTALTSLTTQGAMAASTEVAGVLIARIGYAIPFVGSALVQLASAITFSYYFRHQPPPEEITVAAERVEATDEIAVGARPLAISP